MFGRGKMTREEAFEWLKPVKGLKGDAWYRYVGDMTPRTILHPAAEPEQKPLQEPYDGSTLFTTTDSAYLRQHLTAMDLSIVQDMAAQGKFKELTEQQVVDMFL